MQTRLTHLWQTASTSYWFVPSVMLVASAGLAALLLTLDRSRVMADTTYSWLYGGGSEGARTLLSTVASSVITVAGVVFSITIAALTQAASQFGPRLLRNFMRDRGNQIVLGTFVATFLYCLLVLRTIRGELEEGAPFVPQASVTAGVLLAVASIGVLVYFIHHVSLSLQAPMVVAAVRQDLEEVIQRIPGNESGSAEPAQPGAAPSDLLPPGFDDASTPVESRHEGYVQAIDYQALMKIAVECELVLRIRHRPGHHLIRRSTLLLAFPRERWREELAKKINDAIITGRNATPEQDVEFTVRQLVEVAVRALSPGINDPFTAINCIDALGGAVSALMYRGLPGPARFDESGRLRLLLDVTTLPGVVDAAFNAIRQYGRQSVPVLVRLLEVLTTCAEQARMAPQRETLSRHVELIWREAQRNVEEASDLADIQDRYACARSTLAAETLVNPGHRT